MISDPLGTAFFFGAAWAARIERAEARGARRRRVRRTPRGDLQFVRRATGENLVIDQAGIS
jgi:hypothetical protein